MAGCSAKTVATSAPEVGQQQASGILGANDSFRDFEQVAKVGCHHVDDSMTQYCIMNHMDGTAGAGAWT
jgi:hypothetical protein